MKHTKLIFILLWMGVIFYLSSQDGTVSQNTSDGIVYMVYDSIFYKLFPLTYENYELLSFVIRKFAHFTEYFILAFLWMWYFVDFKKEKMHLYSFFLSVLYAIFDETHQLFVSGRSFQITDASIDILGAIVAIFIFSIIWRKRCHTLKNH